MYTFQYTPDNLIQVGNNTTKNYVESYHWNRGQLTSKTVYNQAGTPLRKTINYYTTQLQTWIDNIGLLTYKKLTFTPSYQVVVPFCNMLYQEYVNPRYYGWLKALTRLTRTEEYTYSGANQLVSSAEVDYNGDYQPKEQRSFATDGTVLVKRLFYPFDYSIPASPTGFVKGIQLLQQQNVRSTALEEYSFKKISATDASPKLTTGRVTLYEPHPTWTSLAFPKEVHQLDVQNGCCLQSSYVPVSISSGTLQKDARYTNEVTFNSYDGNVNLTDFTLRNGLKTHLNWLTVSSAAAGQSNIFSVLSNETTNYQTTASQLTRYAYDVPLIGLKTVTDPKSQISRYEYNSFGRLRAIRDQNLNLVKTYDYNYAFGDKNPRTLTACTTPAPTLSASASSLCPGQTVTLTASGCTGGTVTWSTGAIGSSIVIGSAGTYNATCLLNACASPASQISIGSSANCSPGAAVGNGCFVISNVASGKVMQLMSDNTLQQQLFVNGQVNQIWKFELQPSGQYKLTAQNGSNLVVQANSANNLELIRAGAYSGTSLQTWSFGETSAGSRQYRVYLSSGNTWDITNWGGGPALELYGTNSPSDPDYNGGYRKFSLTGTTWPTAIPAGNVTEARIFTRANTYPGVDFMTRFIGAQIQGSLDNVNWSPLVTISTNPVANGWNTYPVTTSTNWKYLRFVAGPNGYGELMELPFYNGTTKLTGAYFGSTTTYDLANTPSSTYYYTNVFDNIPTTMWNGARTGTSNYAGIALP